MKRKRNSKPMAPDDPRRKNLIPVKKGEVRNPLGKNGSERLRGFYAFADEQVTVGRGKATVTGSRIELVRLAMYESAIRGDTQSQKLFTEQYQGRARQSIEVTGEGGGPVQHGGDAVIAMLSKLAGGDEKK